MTAVFISHSNAEPDRMEASALHDALTEVGYEHVFLDLTGLRAMQDWEPQLHRHLAVAGLCFANRSAAHLPQLMHDRPEAWATTRRARPTRGFADERIPRSIVCCAAWWIAVSRVRQDAHMEITEARLPVDVDEIVEFVVKRTPKQDWAILRSDLDEGTARGLRVMVARGPDRALAGVAVARTAAVLPAGAFFVIVSTRADRGGRGLGSRLFAAARAEPGDDLTPRVVGPNPMGPTNPRSGGDQRRSRGRRGQPLLRPRPGVRRP